MTILSSKGLNMDDNHQNIIIYNTKDGKASVSLHTKDGMVWMNQNQISHLFDTSVPNISMHISNSTFGGVTSSARPFQWGLLPVMKAEIYKCFAHY